VRSLSEAAKTDVKHFLITATALLVAFAAAFFGYVQQDSSQREMRAVLVAYQVMWPQGWSFFTGLERDVLVVYRFTRSETEPETAPGRLGGLSRIGEARIDQTRWLARRVPERFWQVCDPTPAPQCARRLDRTLVFGVANPVRGPLLCGLVAIAAERPPAHRWFELPEWPRQARRVAIVDVRCPG
jgi:hypothetical protein